MHNSVSHVIGLEGGSLASFLMVDISYHGDILMSPDTRVNLKVIYPDVLNPFSHNGMFIKYT